MWNCLGDLYFGLLVHPDYLNKSEHEKSQTKSIGD
jgi:hypothetical protein